MDYTTSTAVDNPREMFIVHVNDVHGERNFGTKRPIIMIITCPRACPIARKRCGNLHGHLRKNRRCVATERATTSHKMKRMSRGDSVPP
jgi:hypothetical protein